MAGRTNALFCINKSVYVRLQRVIEKSRKNESANELYLVPIQFQNVCNDIIY